MTAFGKLDNPHVEPFQRPMGGECSSCCDCFFDILRGPGQFEQKSSDIVLYFIYKQSIQMIVRVIDGRDDNTSNSDRDKLIKDYDTILKEAALLTTFTGILFGFLLNISVTSSEVLDFGEQIVLATALFSITIATSLFIMPVVYHHIQFPYDSIERFKGRAHRFIIFGLIPTAVTLYLGIVLAFSPIIGSYTFIVAALPFVLVSVLYKMRK
jgi:hypothetical protein